MKELLVRLKSKLDSPYIDSEEKLEILNLFKDFLEYEWLNTPKGIEHIQKELKRLAK